MSSVKRRLNKLEEAANIAAYGIYNIEIGYTTDEKERAIMEDEAYKELERRCNGSVNGLVCFVTKYQ